MSGARPAVLLVEDDEAFARALSRALGMREFDVSCAPDRAAAERMIADGGHDYAILDLNLGGESSLALIAPLKERDPDVRVLVLTGYASIATAVEAIKLGADEYLAKPADADEILAALLGGDAPGAAAAGAPLEPMSVRRLEWEHIQRVLKENGGNISATARKLKMHRRTLQRKLQKRPVAG